MESSLWDFVCVNKGSYIGNSLLCCLLSWHQRGEGGEADGDACSWLHRGLTDISLQVPTLPTPAASVPHHHRPHEPSLALGPPEPHCPLCPIHVFLGAASEPSVEGPRSRVQELSLERASSRGAPFCSPEAGSRQAWSLLSVGLGRWKALALGKEAAASGVM